VVASGAAVSQVISMAFSPLITRLYGPDAYGIQGVFMTIAGIMGAIAALTYPIAIVLPKREIEAIGVAKLSVYISIAMSLLAAILLFFLGREILLLLSAEEILPYIYLIPAFMFITAVSAVLGQWLIRKKAFALTAKIKVWQTFIVSSAKAGLGVMYPTAAVLVVTNVLGGFLGVVLIIFGLRKMHLKIQKDHTTSGSALSSWDIAKQYRDFPLLRAPHELLNTISLSLPIIMLAAFYGPASVGYYSIASAVLGMPMALVGNSVMQVFYPRVTDAVHSGEDVKALIIKATVGLALSGALVFVVAIIVGPSLFTFVFGSEWQMAGVYAQWLSILFFFQFINRPAVSSIPALRLQKGLMIYEVFSTGTKIFALYVGYIVFKSEIITIALFSGFGGVAYMSLILWVIFRSGKIVTEA
jgi:O-antigen/teichoic acid export membrane protein